MEVTSSNKTSAYLRSGSYVENTVRKASRNSTDDSVQPDYKVSISSEAKQSLSDFNSTQQAEKTDFVRDQRTEKNAKERELYNKKQSFEKKQASDAKGFEMKQATEQMQFMQEIRQNDS